MKKIKVKNHTHLVRDDNSQAIVNTNLSSYRQRIAKIKRNRKNQDEITELKNQIEELKSIINNLI
jgi:prefoldin subunit 5